MIGSWRSRDYDECLQAMGRPIVLCVLRRIQARPRSAGCLRDLTVFIPLLPADLPFRALKGRLPSDFRGPVQLCRIPRSASLRSGDRKPHLLSPATCEGPALR